MLKVFSILKPVNHLNVLYTLIFTLPFKYIKTPFPLNNKGYKITNFSILLLMLADQSVVQMGLRPATFLVLEYVVLRKH